MNRKQVVAQAVLEALFPPIRRAKAHPPERDLLAYTKKQLESAAYDRVELHCAFCASCAAAAARLKQAGAKRPKTAPLPRNVVPFPGPGHRRENAATKMAPPRRRGTGVLEDWNNVAAASVPLRVELGRLPLGLKGEVRRNEKRRTTELILRSTSLEQPPAITVSWPSDGSSGPHMFHQSDQGWRLSVDLDLKWPDACKYAQASDLIIESE